MIDKETLAKTMLAIGSGAVSYKLAAPTIVDDIEQKKYGTLLTRFVSAWAAYKYAPQSLDKYILKPFQRLYANYSKLGKWEVPFAVFLATSVVVPYGTFVFAKYMKNLEERT